MKVTFLVGNGFDMALGVDTSYRAFYNWYLEQESPNHYVQDLKDNIQKYLEGEGENWSDFELGLGKYTKHFSTNEIQGFLKCYEDAHNNIIKFLNNQISNADIRITPNIDLISSVKALINFYTELPSSEAQYFEKAIGNKLEFDFISFNYTDLFSKSIKALAEIAYKEVLLYIHDINIKINSNVINVHGSSTYLPILGVSEGYQIENQELLKIREFKEIMIKSQCVKSIGETWYDVGMNLIDASNVICIFGMSLGSSDSVWWTKIMNNLINNSNSHLIIYWYSRSPLCNVSIFEHITEKRRIKQIVFDYTDLSEKQMQEIESRIHIIFNAKQIFNFLSFKKSQKDIDRSKKEHQLI